ncbi:MAG: DUF881 domain-containing protein [Actinobacteria bacterium]|nr:DUF881 domain-containing protein [Actinomycetota bacterium]
METGVRSQALGGRGLLAGCAAIAFLVVIAATITPPDPEVRLPREYRLAGLIERQEDVVEQLKVDVAELRDSVAELRSQVAARQEASADMEQALRIASREAGLVAVSGPGITVSLTDSDLSESPSGNVNDLVIHSEDVRAIVNALWRAGAEAISMNDQRLVNTSAVLCVGNTLLVNGTVHSPPYVARAIGADRERFESDPLVRRLRREAVAFRLGFAVEGARNLELPAFDGAVSFSHARPGAEKSFG